MPADPPGDAGGPRDAGPKHAGGNPPPKRCPVCGKPADPARLPFCSSRCRDVDLNRWLSGYYVIPGKENAGEDEE